MATFTPRGWRLVRLGGGSEPRLGAIDPAAPQVVRELRERDPIAALRRGLAAGAAEAVGEHVADDAATLAGLPLLAPLQPDEIWAAGVTYERSRSARVEESESAADVYDRVYEAERPEIFLKDAGCRRTVGPNEPVGVRSESTWTVPEAELGLVLGADGEILAFIGGNDLTARDIEAANPSTSHRPSCSRRAARSARRYSCPTIRVRRWRSRCASGTPRARSSTRTARAPGSCTGASLTSPVGACARTPSPTARCCSRAPGIVPPDEVALAPGYRVEVEVEGIGVLANPVRAA